jgi:hypothetical protein
VPVLSGICAVLWYISGSDNDAYLAELEAEKLKNPKKIIKKYEKKLTEQEIRAEKLKPFYRKPISTSDKVTKIMNKANGLKFRERLSLVNSLPRNLSSEDKQALYYYLKYEKSNRDTHCMKNDMLNILRDQKTPPAELTDVMLDLFYDKSQDIVVRSYALQHMRPWYMDEKMQDPAVKQAFYDGLEETENEIAGVALLALKYLSEHDENFDKNYISSKASEIASNEGTYILTRISAVGVCGKMDSTEALPTIRDLSNNASNPVNLRISAIASLGEIGDQSDMATLESIASSGKRPFSTAARTALNKLRKNINNIEK